MRVEFLLEEPSMENLLRIILPKVLPPGFTLDENCFLRPHNGKGDLLKSIPKKVRAFSNFHETVKIIILHDQDSNDCKELKDELRKICDSNGDCPVLIRIVCRELEAWYLGDLEAIQCAYPHFKAIKYAKKAKFRNPDTCNAFEDLRKIIPDIQKGSASKNIPKHFDLGNNKSNSFNIFLKGLLNFLKD